MTRDQKFAVHHQSPNRMATRELNIIANGVTPREIIDRILEDGPIEESIHVLDLDDVVRKHRIWVEQMPQVKPFYAIKCHDDPIIIETLMKLGTGFDCASKGEIMKAIQLGVHPESIIFAQPAKSVESIAYAKAHGVNLMTFDGQHELDKISSHFPEASLVLRFRYDSDQVFVPLGRKFGCDPQTEAPDLLQHAKKLNLKVTGLSFHIGSGCDDANCYEKAIETARQIFDHAKLTGHNITLLDVGGGFPGAKGKPIDSYAERINSAIMKCFGDQDDMQFIAEPGRYYVASAVSIITNVIAKRVTTESNGKKVLFYYVNDGIFGSFYSAGHEQQIVYPVVQKQSNQKLTSWIWGPSCDPLDLIARDIFLPELDIGDFIVFENGGAYSLVLANRFNGFPLPKVKIFVSQDIWQSLHNPLKGSESK
ncbi:ornithine decarboxylase 1-like [Toxorhynchites rutilus septentrionalis]|uniref:ornithine decarboxylase 1-like n=1 Tax=Toxorhynchites rutilus septentrionalis TaxID=329112 RepID=UPI0024784FD6|nr:ornithine decarboxylase 1-like [Toxorhynchites rutilus septentrionalis]